MEEEYDFSYSSLQLLHTATNSSLLLLKRQNSSLCVLSSSVNHRNGAKTMMRIIPSLSLWSLPPIENTKKERHQKSFWGVMYNTKISIR